MSFVTCSEVRVVVTLMRERDLVTTMVLIRSICRMVMNSAMAARYSAPVKVTLPGNKAVSVSQVS